MKTIEKIWFTDTAVCVRSADGLQACECFADYPRLRKATPQQLSNYETDSFGIHWPELDEDLSFDGFFEDKPKSELYRFFMAHPELNASAIARKMGMKQSLFAAYISGTKKPSDQRRLQIYSTIRQIGKELCAEIAY